jgi:Rho-binding antiterminator
MRLGIDDVDRCDFIDVLEEAVVRKRPVAIALRDGESFIEEVVDVVTENHQDFAVFRSGRRINVDAIAAATRAEPQRTPPPTLH